MQHPIFFLLTVVSSTAAIALPSEEVVCAYAPSQSKVVAAVSGAAGGATATASAVAAATGLTAVAHSSGALILTGSSGYIAGTIGATAATIAAAPVVVGVGLFVGGSAVTLEIVCGRRNHPDQVKKINEAATEFAFRFSGAMRQVRVVGGDLKQAVVPAVGKAAVTVKQGVSDVWEYVYRNSVAVGKAIGK